MACGERRLRWHLFRHQRRRHPAYSATFSIDDCFGRAGSLVWPCESAPEELRNLRAGSRSLRSRFEDINARGRGSQDVRVPAQRMGLTDPGVLRQGMKADFVVFDPMTVRDVATFERPHQYAEGVSVVVVNGQVVFDNGGITAARPGEYFRAQLRAVTPFRAMVRTRTASLRVQPTAHRCGGRCG